MFICPCCDCDFDSDRKLLYSGEGNRLPVSCSECAEYTVCFNCVQETTFKCQRCQQQNGCVNIHSCSLLEHISKGKLSLPRDNLIPHVAIAAQLRKKFSGNWYTGMVTHLSFVDGFLVYKIVYEDGDSEDLTESEVRALLMEPSMINNDNANNEADVAAAAVIQDEEDKKEPNTTCDFSFTNLSKLELDLNDDQLLDDNWSISLESLQMNAHEGFPAGLKSPYAEITDDGNGDDEIMNPALNGEDTKKQNESTNQDEPSEEDNVSCASLDMYFAYKKSTNEPVRIGMEIIVPLSCGRKKHDNSINESSAVQQNEAKTASSEETQKSNSEDDKMNQEKNRPEDEAKSEKTNEAGKNNDINDKKRITDVDSDNGKSDPGDNTDKPERTSDKEIPTCTPEDDSSKQNCNPQDNNVKEKGSDQDRMKGKNGDNKKRRIGTVNHLMSSKKSRCNFIPELGANNSFVQPFMTDMGKTLTRRISFEPGSVNIISNNEGENSEDSEEPQQGVLGDYIALMVHQCLQGMIKYHFMNKKKPTDDSWFTEEKVLDMITNFNDIDNDKKILLVQFRDLGSESI